MTATSSLAVFGNLTIDDLVFPDGTTRWAVPGGSAIYAAFGISLWTGSASIVAPVGSDYPAELLPAQFDLSRCRPLPQTLRNWGLYEEDGSRHFVSRNASRNWREFSPKPEDAATGSQSAAHVAPLPHDVAIELCRELRKAGTSTISLDLDDHDLAGRANLDATIDLLREADLLLPSLQDAFAIFPGVEKHEVLHRMRSVAPHAALIAVKCGSEGVFAHAKGSGHVIHVPAVSVQVADTTGAGDAFCGGALAGFEMDGDPMSALLYGSVSASFCVEGLGLSGLVTATEETAHTRLSALRKRTQSTRF